MTSTVYNGRCKIIIPYQELLGNYDTIVRLSVSLLIIPYQELLGNYDIFP